MQEKDSKKGFFRFLKSTNKTTVRNVINKSFEDSETFLLLFDCSSQKKYDEFLNICSFFQSKNKKLYSIGFHNLPALPLYCQNSSNTTFLTKKELKKSGKIKKDEVHELLKNKFDVLISVINSNNNAISNITSKANANLKIGLTSEQASPLFDISFKADINISQEEILKMAINFQNTFQNKQIWNFQ